jgi:septum site-determining protein MinD
MDTRVITITSGKGGVGKTTITANVATALAMMGRKVVAIDSDIGLRNLDVVMGLENRIVYDLVDVVEGRCRLRQAMIKDKRLPELYLIPAAQTRDKMAVSPSDMILVCDQLRDEVDCIIGMIEADEKGPGRLLINRIKPAMVARGDMLSIDDILEILAVDLLGVIPEDETILISTNRGMPVALSATNSSSASQAFHNIGQRLEGVDVPLMDLMAKNGFFNRLRGLVGRRSR